MHFRRHPPQRVSAVAPLAHFNENIARVGVLPTVHQQDAKPVGGVGVAVIDLERFDVELKRALVSDLLLPHRMVATLSLVPAGSTQA